MNTRFRLKAVAALIVPAALLGGCAAMERAPDAPKSAVQPVQRVSRAEDLGRYYYVQGRYTESVEAYAQAVSANPTLAVAHNGLASSYAALGENSLAEQHFQEAARLAPDQAYMLRNLGQIYLVQGRQAEAADVLRKAIALEPQEPKGHLLLAEALRGVPAAATEKPAEDHAKSVEGSAVAAAQTPPDAVAGAAPSARTDAPATAAVPASVAATAKTPADRSAAQPGGSGARAPAAAAASKRVGESGGVEVAPLRTQWEAAPAPTPLPQPGNAPAKKADKAASDPAIKKADKGTSDATAKKADNGANSAAAEQAASAPGVRAFRLEVSNGTPVKGFARRTAAQLAAQGLPQGEITSVPGAGRRYSQISYRPEFRAEADAVRNALPLETVAMVPTDSLKVDVQLVVGQDLVAEKAALAPNHGSVKAPIKTALR